MKTYVILLVSVLILSSVAVQAQPGSFVIKATKPQLLLKEEDMRGIRTNIWIPVDPSIPYHTDPVTGEEYETNVERGTLTFAVVNDRRNDRYRRIDIVNGGSMIIVRNYCIGNNETLTYRNRTQVQLYVYMVGQDYANMLDCDGRQLNYVSVHEIDRIVSLVREVPPSLLLTMTSIRVALKGAAANARGLTPRRN